MANNEQRDSFVILVILLVFNVINTCLLVVSLAVSPGEAPSEAQDTQDLETVISYHGEHLEDSTLQAIMDWHFRTAPMCVDPD